MRLVPGSTVCRWGQFKQAKSLMLKRRQLTLHKNFRSRQTRVPFLKPHPPIGRVESARSKLIMKTVLPPNKTIVPKAFRVMFDDDAGESTAGISDSTTTAPPTAIIHSAVNNFSLDATYFGR